MLQRLRFKDLEVLKAFATHGPRNISKIARAVGISRSTLQDWIKRMSSSPNFYLRFFASIYHTDIGLKKAVVFTEAKPGRESILLDCLKINGFWIYLSRCYGMFDGYIAEYTIPKGHEEELEEFLDQIKKLGVAKNIQVFWSTCFQGVNPTSNWFDMRSEKWIFPWDKWIEEIFAERTKLPRSLVEPESYPINTDRMDILIMKELEKDATISFSKLAKMLGITLQAVRYRYEKLLKHGLIDEFDISFFPYGLKTSTMSFFVFYFDNHEKMAKFASSLLNKPFVFFVGKILGYNTLVSQIVLPNVEFNRFKASLSELIKEGFLQTYIYAIQDKPRFRQTISYEFFEHRSWIYDHQKHVESLQKLVKGY